MDEMYFKVYANCKIVKGMKRSVICDVQKGTIHFIPNELADVLLKSNGNLTIHELKKTYKNKMDKGIDLFINKLLELGLGFITTKDDGFIDIEEKFFYPGLISNAIIDIDSKSNHPYQKIFSNLNEHNCAHVELRFMEFLPIDKIAEILSFMDQTGIRSIYVLFPYSLRIKYDDWIDLYKKFTRLASVLIYNAPFESFEFEDNLNIRLIRDSIKSSLDCGKISADLFSVSILNFMESKKYNSCLNCKTSIDVKGEIKNCPSMRISFGNINTISISDAIDQMHYKDLWYIKKDEIKVCKDCEFRYVCTDCRAFVEDPFDIYSKPLKCGYNPYTNEWEEWSIHPFKQKAIEYYGMTMENHNSSIKNEM